MNVPDTVTVTVEYATDEYEFALSQLGEAIAHHRMLALEMKSAKTASGKAYSHSHRMFADNLSDVLKALETGKYVQPLQGS